MKNYRYTQCITLSRKIVSFLLLIVVLFISPCYSQQQSDFAKPVISIGVVVEDLDKSMAFYKEVIGMVEVREINIGTEKAKRMGLSDKDSFNIKVLKLANSEMATEWKLMSFGKKSTKTKEFIPEGNGIRYVTIFVSSMQPLLERIKKYGIKMLGSTPTMLDEKRQFVLVQDPDGNFIELIGPG